MFILQTNSVSDYENIRKDFCLVILDMFTGNSKLSKVFSKTRFPCFVVIVVESHG